MVLFHFFCCTVLLLVRTLSELPCSLTSSIWYLHILCELICFCVCKAIQRVMCLKVTAPGPTSSHLQIQCHAKGSTGKCNRNLKLSTSKYKCHFLSLNCSPLVFPSKFSSGRIAENFLCLHALSKHNQIPRLPSSSIEVSDYHFFFRCQSSYFLLDS